MPTSPGNRIPVFLTASFDYGLPTRVCLFGCVIMMMIMIFYVQHLLWCHLVDCWQRVGVSPTILGQRNHREAWVFPSNHSNYSVTLPEGSNPEIERCAKISEGEPMPVLTT